MATTTTNFGWDIPQSTDLVKDGATAIAALGQDIDTALVDLKGGTTGQILSKASGTDLDYTWISPNPGDITAVTAGTGISGGGTSGDVTITNSMATAIDAKGDLIVGTGADTFSRLAVGTNGYVLTADSAEATGTKWAAVASGGLTLLSTTACSTGSVTVSSISGAYKNLYIRIEAASTGNGIPFVKFNGGSSNFYGAKTISGTSASLENYNGSYLTGRNGLGGADIWTIFIYNYAGSQSYKNVQAIEGMNTGSVQTQTAGGTINDSSAITSITYGVSSGSFSSGNIYIYGEN